MLARIRRRLSWKLFLSYLVIVVVGALVLLTAAELAVPAAFERHMAAMAAVLGPAAEALDMDLFANFRRAVTEALLFSALAAGVVALLLSLLVARRVVQPVQEMMEASDRIAAGHYDERVGVPGDPRQEDMDELGRLAVSFNQMASRLERTEALRLELIGNVAHELRTPLASIQGYMEGLIDGVLPAEATTFQQVHRETGRLQKLVDDLQELSRVEAGSLALDLRPISVSSFVGAATARLARQFDEKGVALAYDVPPHLPIVRADPDRVTQILLNLVGNALQYTPPGGQVRITARQQGDMLRLEVADTGVGIAAQHLPRLFERFYRVDASRSRAGGGSGIGLTIARHLVEAQGGQIQAASDGPGQGSTFTFTLPLA